MILPLLHVARFVGRRELCNTALKTTKVGLQFKVDYLCQHLDRQYSGEELATKKRRKLL